jgi:hypothetical protein
MMYRTYFRISRAAILLYYIRNYFFRKSNDIYSYFIMISNYGKCLYCKKSLCNLFVNLIELINKGGIKTETKF